MTASRSISAGIGLRPGADAAEILACLDAALASAGVSAPGRLATVQARAAEPGLAAAAGMRGLPVIPIPDEALRGEAAGCATRSTRIASLYGVGSVAEAAALAAAGPGAELVLPRLVLGRVTCALAREAAP